MSRVAIAIAAHGLPGLTGILSVPIEGTHSLSLTVVRAYSAAGGGWAVQQGRGHVLATWLAMAGPCCGGRALALRLDRGSGGGCLQAAPRDPGSGVRCVYRSSYGYTRVYWSQLPAVGAFGRVWWPWRTMRTQKVAFLTYRDPPTSPRFGTKPVGMNIPVDPLRTTGSDEGIFIRTRLGTCRQQQGGDHEEPSGRLLG